MSSLQIKQMVAPQKIEEKNLLEKNVETLEEKKKYATELNKAYQVRERERIDAKKWMLNEYNEMLLVYTGDVATRLSARRQEILKEIKDEEARMLAEYRESFVAFSHDKQLHYGVDKEMPIQAFTNKLTDTESVIKTRIDDWYYKENLKRVKSEEVKSTFDLEVMLTLDDDTYKDFLLFCKRKGIKCIEC